MTAFTGKILNEGNSGFGTSPFAETSWPNDTQTLPAQNPAAWSETNWPLDDNTAIPTVIAGLLVESDW